MTFQDMELSSPSVRYKDSFLAAAKEFEAQGENLIEDESIHDVKNNFSTYVDKLIRNARGENLPPGYVPVSHFWLIDDGEFIGRVSVRHTLNEHLKSVGDHIGYAIRPSRRRKGYGTHILNLALPKAKQLGMYRVLVTCVATNIASRRIIEKNGGVLENEIIEADGTHRLRFWIDI